MDTWAKHEIDLQKIAWGLVGNSGIKQDILQEMRICLWQLKEGDTKAFYLQRAKCRAIDFLRKYYPRIVLPMIRETGKPVSSSQ